MALDMTKFYTVTQKDAETNLDSVLAKAANGSSNHDRTPGQWKKHLLHANFETGVCSRQP